MSTFDRIVEEFSEIRFQYDSELYLKVLQELLGAPEPRGRTEEYYGLVELVLFGIYESYGGGDCAGFGG